MLGENFFAPENGAVSDNDGHEDVWFLSGSSRSGPRVHGRIFCNMLFGKIIVEKDDLKKNFTHGQRFLPHTQIFRVIMTIAGKLKSIPFRDVPVDVLRGLAITIMVGANLIPYLLISPAPFWLRLISSIAAPLFIFLSGMMVALSCRIKRHTFSYFLVRGGFVVVIAALLDLLANGIIPFMSVDVLYLIGFSLPVAFLFLSLSLRTRMAVFASILVATPLLQGIFGYSPLPINMSISALLGGAALPPLSAIISHGFIDGWFPLIPWLGIALLGAQAGTFRWQGNTIVSFANRKLMLLASGILVLGAIFWFFVPGPLLTRLGYVELFYPPTVEFLFFITGVIFCLFVAADLLPVTKAIFDPIRAMGECSLAIYILHIVIIELFIEPLQINVPLGFFLADYLIFLCGMILFAYLIRWIRYRVRSPSFIIRVLIGG